MGKLYVGGGDTYQTSIGSSRILYYCMLNTRSEE